MSFRSNFIRPFLPGAWKSTIITYTQLVIWFEIFAILFRKIAKSRVPIVSIGTVCCPSSNIIIVNHMNFNASYFLASTRLRIVLFSISFHLKVWENIHTFISLHIISLRFHSDCIHANEWNYTIEYTEKISSSSPTVNTQSEPQKKNPLWNHTKLSRTQHRHTHKKISF